MEIQICTIPGSGMRTVGLGNSATVADAISEAGFHAEGYTIAVDGVPATESSVLRDGQRVFLTKNAKGNGTLDI